MDTQILVVLFLLFGVISTVFKKLREHQNPEPDESRLKRKHPSRQTGPKDPFEEVVDLSEWDILLGTPSQEKKPEARPSLSEFREVQAQRHVDESNTGPEFQEVHGKRSVQETNIGPEFRAVQATRPVNEASAYDENEPTNRPQRSRGTAMSKIKKRRKHRLSFSHRSIRQAIVYSEIIGRPRAENKPF
jgi:hypothetical protein